MRTNTISDMGKIQQEDGYDEREKQRERERREREREREREGGTRYSCKMSSARVHVRIGSSN